MAARGLTPAQTERADLRQTDEQTAHPKASSTGVSKRRGGGSHSMDRIVRIFVFEFVF